MSTQNYIRLRQLIPVAVKLVLTSFKNLDKLVNFTNFKMVSHEFSVYAILFCNGRPRCNIEQPL